MALRRAVFLDKDGTLVCDVPFNVDPHLIRLVPGAAAALRRLEEAGYALCVVSNQPGVAHGLFERQALGAVEERLRALFEASGATLLACAFCPHHPEGRVARYAVRCDCRKPSPGLLLDTARRRGIDLARSWMVGDILDDVEAGRRAGCRTVFVDAGHETEWRSGPGRQPDLVAASLFGAAQRILAIGAGS